MPDNESKEADFDEFALKLIEIFQSHLGNDRVIKAGSLYWKSARNKIEQDESNSEYTVYQAAAFRLFNISQKYTDRIFFDKKKVLEDIQAIEYHLGQAKRHMDAIPPEVLADIYSATNDRIRSHSLNCLQYSEIDGKNTNAALSDFLNKVAFGPLQSMIDLSVEVIGKIGNLDGPNFKGLYQGEVDKRSIHDQIEATNYPHMEYYNQSRSKGRLTKALIIKELRMLWQDCTGKEAPKSVRYEGSDFGDLVTDVFEVLGIEGDARAAVDAWRKEYT